MCVVTGKSIKMSGSDEFRLIEVKVLTVKHATSQPLTLTGARVANMIKSVRIAICQRRTVFARTSFFSFFPFGLLVYLSLGLRGKFNLAFAFAFAGFEPIIKHDGPGPAYPMGQRTRRHLVQRLAENITALVTRNLKTHDRSLRLMICVPSVHSGTMQPANAG